VRAIVRNEDAILTVSSLVPESLQLGAVALSLPAVVNRNGVARVVSISLSPSEQEPPTAATETLMRHLASIAGGSKTESANFEAGRWR
jgi:L-lactate dehydrogenase